MLQYLTAWVPQDGIRILIALFLSFLLGLQREEHIPEGEAYAFGGVRTFPLIGILGYALALISVSSLAPVSVGFAVTGALLSLSYWHKLEKAQTAGATTEISALATYVIGALCAHDQLWIATTLTVISLLLLELKQALESLSIASRRMKSSHLQSSCC